VLKGTSTLGAHFVLLGAVAEEVRLQRSRSSASEIGSRRAAILGPDEASRVLRSPTMQQRKLGQSPLAVTPLALGGNVFGWTADEPTSFAVLDAFVAHEGNAIDTADSYSYWVPGHQGGESETVIGRWLQRRGRRDDVVIATKVGMWEKRKGLSRDNIIAACEDSLRRLGVEFIDLYWLHRDDEQTAPDEYLGALDTLVRTGKVRAVGASNFGVARFEAALGVSARKSLVPFVAQQPEYSLLSRDIEKDLMPLCARESVAILPYFPLASGFLTGKYRTAADKTKSVRGAGAVKHLEGKGKAVLAALDAVAARHGATCAQVALAWVIAKPAIAAPIASATSVAQVTELMGALELTLGAADIAELDKASA
jgi:aryl-alcohol dehydrogenase-like predicted oxidoreductase